MIKDRTMIPDFSMVELDAVQVLAQQRSRKGIEPYRADAELRLDKARLSSPSALRRRCRPRRIVSAKSRA